MKFLRTAMLCAGLVVGVTISQPLAMAAASAATATQPPATELEKPLSREAIHELVSRLTDSQVRSLLIEQLEKSATVSQDAAVSTEIGLAKISDLFRTRLGAMLASGLDLPSVAAGAVHKFSEGRSEYHLLLVAALFAVTLAVSYSAEWMFTRVTGRWRRRLEGTDASTIGMKAGRLITRLILDLVSLAVFLATIAVIFLILYQGHQPSRMLVIALVIATLEIRLTVIAARFLLAPHAPALRLFPIDDRTAIGLSRSAVILAALYAIGHLVSNFLLRWGASEGADDFFATLVGLIFVAVFLDAVWRYRKGITEPIRIGGLGTLGRAIADLWPVLMTVYVIFLFAASIFERLTGGGLRGPAALFSLLIVIAMLLINTTLSRLLVQWQASRPAAEEGSSQLRAGRTHVLIEGINIAVAVAGFGLIARLWDLDIFALAARGIGERFASAIIDVVVILLLAYFIWQLIRTTIDRAIEREAGPQSATAPSEQGGVGTSRLRTLLPLARGFAFLTVCVIAAMMALTAIGINIGPLLAGAGVIGIAIGFGAQTLVRDVISGAFYLLDDAFRLGEYVDVGEAKGTVEKIGIRSMQLRHHRGPLNIVPYGAIRRLNNQSRDWVVEKLELRLTYDTDVAKVDKIIKKIGQELMADEELGPHILVPLKSQGITAMQDNALLVRAKFMTKPGEQFAVRREAYKRIQKAFDENGIKFFQSQSAAFVLPSAAGSSAAAHPQATVTAAESAPKT